MAERMRFMMVGGFLGAGKTTLIARLASAFQQQGLSVGVVTNDQAADLVDTQLLRELGLDVSEVAGSCFCCNFDGLQDAIGRLAEGRRPDVVIAEPVGSCTDLVATVALPMQDMLGEDFTICPYAVLIKPSHGKRILAAGDAAGRDGPGRRGGFSPEAAYIFHKQLEEADVLLLNRCDELSESEMSTIEGVLRRQYPDKPLLRISAREGTNVDDLAERLLTGQRDSRALMDVDYDTYAAGEAELGWLNAAVELSADRPVAVDALLQRLASNIQSRCIDADAEIAHLKLTAECETGLAVCNVVSNEDRPASTLESGCEADFLCVTVNARVAIDPEELETIVTESLEKECTAAGARLSVVSMRSFRPGRPVPTHRVTG